MNLSIIIPVYNCSELVCRSLDSIYGQNLYEDSFEVIVIDDCSTDNTLSILNEYASTHRNMIVIHQNENLRQGAARNRGIGVATGEWIMFLDADDELCWDGVHQALKEVAASDCDICFYEFEYQLPDGGWKRFVNSIPTGVNIMQSRDYLEKYYTTWYNAPWRNIYRTNFLQTCGIRFKERVRWEDCDWTVKVYAASGKVMFVSGVGYRYYYHFSSTSLIFDSRAIAERLFAGYRLMGLSSDYEDSMPHLAKVLEEEGRFRYLSEYLRLRKVTQYKVADVAMSFKYSDRLFDSRSLADSYEWPLWESIMLKHRFLALSFLLVARPLALAGRFCMRVARSI